MNALRLTEIVTKSGLFLPYSELEPFLNKKVEIIIIPIGENDENIRYEKNRKTNLVDFFKLSPFFDNTEIDFARDKDTGRDIEL